MSTLPRSDAKISRLQAWLRIDPLARPKIYSQVYANAYLGAVPYWLEILLSAGIATLGLILNSPAVIIGAMLVSPLMSPIMATGLGLAAGDLYLTLKALLKLLASIAAAVLLSAALVWILPFHSPTSEILSRTDPTLLDLAIALLSGLAGSIAVSRSVGSTDGVTTVPGVAIAVALMPPLCTVGFGIGSGLRPEIMRGAALLFLTNIVAIVFSAFLVFLLIGIDCEEVRVEMERGRATEPFAIRLTRGPLASAIKAGGSLHWRVVLLLVPLAAVAWPLEIALRQLAGEAKTREIVASEVAQLVPNGHLVSQQTDVGESSVAIHVVSTSAVTEAAIQHAESEIEKRSGRQANITVESIASQGALAKLMERIADHNKASIASTPAIPPSIDTAATALRKRVEPVLAELWPHEAPLLDFNIGLDPNGVQLHVRYQAQRSLDSISLALLTRSLQEKLGTPDLSLVATRISEPRRERAAR